MKNYNTRLIIHQLICAVLFGLWQHSWLAFGWFVWLNIAAMQIAEHYWQKTVDKSEAASYISSDER